MHDCQVAQVKHICRPIFGQKSLQYEKWLESKPCIIDWSTWGLPRAMGLLRAAALRSALCCAMWSVHASSDAYLACSMVRVGPLPFQRGSKHPAWARTVAWQVLLSSIRVRMGPGSSKLLWSSRCRWLDCRFGHCKHVHGTALRWMASFASMGFKAMCRNSCRTSWTARHWMYV